tara:strand:- start:260 stop:424 length:165 start_codon:yes stop_codon:yes gene_type:complete
MAVSYQTDCIQNSAVRQIDSIFDEFLRKLINFWRLGAFASANGYVARYGWCGDI